MKKINKGTVIAICLISPVALVALFRIVTILISVFALITSMIFPAKVKIEDIDINGILSYEVISEDDALNVAKHSYQTMTTQPSRIEINPIEKYSIDKYYIGYEDFCAIDNKEGFVIDAKDVWTLSQYREPDEITAAFKCLILLKDQSLSFNLVGIASSFSVGGIDQTSSNPAFITTERFNQLYEETDLIGLNTEEAAKKLSEIWIEQSGYRKYG